MHISLPHDVALRLDLEDDPDQLVVDLLEGYRERLDEDLGAPPRLEPPEPNPNVRGPDSPDSPDSAPTSLPEPEHEP